MKDKDLEEYKFNEWLNYDPPEDDRRAAEDKADEDRFVRNFWIWFFSGAAIATFALVVSTW